MSSLIQKNGLIDITDNLYDRSVLAIIIEHWLKNGGEPISISDIASDLSIATSEVVTSLKSLFEAGILAGEYDLDKMSSFFIRQPAFLLAGAQSSFKFPDHEPAKSREDLGKDECQWAGETYRAFVEQVEGSEEFTLNVLSRPSALDDSDDEPWRDVLVDFKFDTEMEAWKAWDEWIEALEAVMFPIINWVRSVIESFDDEVAEPPERIRLSLDAFQRLEAELDANSTWPEDVDERELTDSMDLKYTEIRIAGVIVEAADDDNGIDLQMTAIEPAFGQPAAEAAEETTGSGEAEATTNSENGA